MPNDPVIEPQDGLFSERQIALPLLIAILITLACYLTFARFYVPGEQTEFPHRYLSNGYCVLIMAVFWAASLYALLQALGLAIERYHLTLFGQHPLSPPSWYALACFLSGRRDSDESGFFMAIQRWYHKAQSSEDFAKLSDYLLLLRGQQHQHNFAPLNFVVWVMPLLGFIGTVIGITQAIGGLEEVVAASAAPSSGGLENVLAGLSFAFDTTFIGLILVIPTMLYILPLRAKAQTLDMRYYEILLDRSFNDPPCLP